MSTSGGQPSVGQPASSLGKTGDRLTTSSQAQAAAANVAAVATLAASAGNFTFMTAVILSVGQAAAAANLLCTITGLVGGTWSIPLVGGTTTGDQLFLEFGIPIPGAAVNTAIVATVPASGAAGPPISATLVGMVF